MDAPHYPPAIVFEAPTSAPRQLSVQNFSTAELMQMPAAWAIVVKHLPAIKLIAGSQRAKAGLANMTVAELASYTGADTAAALAAIDAELLALPKQPGAIR
jgi:hypothetical protein